jgi:hypothetical protein
MSHIFVGEFGSISLMWRIPAAVQAVVPPDAQLRELLIEYRVLLAAKPGELQRRGQQFNQFLATLFTVWGVEALADQRGIDNRDEIDVALAVGRVYYILEAKWYAKPINLDPVAKLEMRLRVRPPGTGGILVSMSGFTAPVYAYTEYHPEIILLDRTHIEAMLTGLLGPERFFHHLVFWTSRRGGSSVRLRDLLEPPRIQPPPQWETAGPGAIARVPDVVQSTDGVAVRPLISSCGNWSSPWIDMTLEREDQVLLTSADGILRLNPETGESTWISSVPGCVGAAFPDDGEAVIAQCNHAIVRFEAEQLTAVAGSFPLTGSYLLANPDGGFAVLSTSGPPSQGGTHTLTLLGGSVGAERSFAIDFVGGVRRGALLPGGRLYLASTLYVGVLEVGESMSLTEDNWFEGPPLVDTTVVLAIDENTMLTGGRGNGIGALIYATDLRTRQHTKLLEIQALRVEGMVIRADRRLCVLFVVNDDASRERAMLAEITLPAVLVP